MSSQIHYPSPPRHFHHRGSKSGRRRHQYSRFTGPTHEDLWSQDELLSSKPSFQQHSGHFSNDFYYGTTYSNELSHNFYGGRDFRSSKSPTIFRPTVPSFLQPLVDKYQCNERHSNVFTPSCSYPIIEEAPISAEQSSLLVEEIATYVCGILGGGDPGATPNLPGLSAAELKIFAHCILSKYSEQLFLRNFHPYLPHLPTSTFHHIFPPISTLRLPLTLFHPPRCRIMIICTL